MSYLLFFFLVVFLIPVVLFLVIYISNKNNLVLFFQFLFYKHNITYFSNTNKKSFIDKLMFLPHPFLNWSLNPYFRNTQGRLVHTKEGFRKTLDFESIVEYLKKKKNTFKIVCIGGSTTHCSDIDNFEETWPSLINTKLLRENIDATVINFGVGAWTTIQSYTRCITWFSKLKPDLLIFYHAKNDLTSLMNGNLKEDSISPDYQNVITQFSDRYFTNFSKFYFCIPLVLLFYYFYNFVKYKEGLLGIYKPKAEQNSIGMKRFDQDFMNSIVFRHEAIVNLCKLVNCKVLYIPEIVIDGIYRELLINKIFPEIKKVLVKYDHLEWMDIDSVMPKSKNYFWDKMHFTKEGNLILMSSIQGFSSPKFEHYKNTNMISPIEYSAMKAGIISVTKYLAKYYKKENIRVNCISPGGILDDQPANFLKKYKSVCASKGMLDPDELSGTFLYLLSDYSKFVTGQNLIVDDGWSL